ncbi:hypothetical protein NDU88_002222 [Pleurodeles waltl]|uniref:Uncharacterized protein n=1 Tax=Pleurodeles waltl TaxID=8319 RepID=A0AAV7LEZ7_PLEWA|nr:hypothetical protein NDU88_002222 [Pleurodeles waltl]
MPNLPPATGKMSLAFRFLTPEGPGEPEASAAPLVAVSSIEPGLHRRISCSAGSTAPGHRLWLLYQEAHRAPRTARGPKGVPTRPQAGACFVGKMAAAILGPSAGLRRSVSAPQKRTTGLLAACCHDRKGLHTLRSPATYFWSYSGTESPRTGRLGREPHGEAATAMASGYAPAECYDMFMVFFETQIPQSVIECS